MGAKPHARHNKLKDDADWLALPTLNPDGSQKETVKDMLATAYGFSQRGCCCDAKWILDSFIASGLTFKDRTTKDPDFAGLYTELMRGEDGGTEEINAAMDKDAFMV